MTMKLISVLFAFLVFAQPDLADVRKAYPSSASSEENAKAFHAKLADVTSKDAHVLLAYKGAAETLLSKFGDNIPDKISHMRTGADLIDAAAAASPTNIEIRMIRLSVQENVPRIVNYRKNKKEDKAFILANYRKAGAIEDYIANFILRSESFTDAEKKAAK